MTKNKAQQYKELGKKSLRAGSYNAAILYFKERLKQPSEDIEVFDMHR